MMENLEKALSLLGIGMVTVFVALALVVVVGNLLIRIVNAMTPEVDSQKSITEDHSSSDISPQKIAAITSAVHQLSGGKATVEKIEKL